MHRRPLGEIDDARVTVPVNPLTGVTLTIEVPVVPARTDTPIGLADMVKSGLGEELESLQAVSGWSSHPEKLCQLSERCASSQ